MKEFGGTNILPPQLICRNCNVKLIDQAEPEEEIEIVETSMQDNMSFESATEFVN